MTVNDIDQHELDCAPQGLAKAFFNIAGDLSETDARPPRPEPRAPAPA
jgi:hypothetical protein